MENFSDALEQLDPIDGHPSDTNLTRIREVVALLLLQIPYDKTGAHTTSSSSFGQWHRTQRAMARSFPNPHMLAPTTKILMTIPRTPYVGAKKQACWLRHLRDGAARHCAVHPCRRQGYVGAGTLRHWDVLHRRCTKGASWSPPSGVHRLPCPRPPGAA